MNAPVLEAWKLVLEIDPAVPEVAGNPPHLRVRLDEFRLAVAHNLTTLTGSALLGLMLVAGAITPEAAWQAAHVDEDFQIAVWGTDEEAAQRRVWRRVDFDGSLQFLNLLKIS